MYLKRDLGWARGFPASRNLWVALPPHAPARELALDGDLLRRSQRTLNLLRRELPEELPRIVGDAERFFATHRALLEVLKPTIHHGAPLPETPLDSHPFATGPLLRETRRIPASEPIRRAFRWYGFTDPDQLSRALRWLEAHRPQVGVIEACAGDRAPRVLLRLWQLAHTLNPKRVAPVVELLGAEGAWTHRTELAQGYVGALSAVLETPTKKPPNAPTVPLPKKLIEWVEMTACADRATQRRSLELFAAVVDPSVVVGWGRFWEQLQHGYERARLMPDDDDALQAKRHRARKRLERFEERVPPSLPSQVLHGSLRRLPSAEAEPLHRIALRTLKRIPKQIDGAPARLAFAEHWTWLWSSPHYRADALLRYLAAFNGYLRDTEDVVRALTPWRAVWTHIQRARGRTAYTVDQDAIDDLRSRKQLDTFFRILAEQTEAVEPGTAEILCTLVAALPESRVRGALESLCDEELLDRHLYEPTLRLAGMLTEQNPARFAQVAKTLDDSEERYGDLDEVLLPLVRRFREVDALELMTSAVLDREVGLLIDVAYQCDVLRENQQRVPPIWPMHAVNTEWQTRYPSELDAALALLVRADPEAPSTAAKLLRKEFPSEGELRAEIDELEAVSERNDGQTQRLENLRQRLNAPRPVSSKRLRNLDGKLRNAARRKLIGSFADRVRASYLSLLPTLWRVDEVPEWMGDHRVLTALLPVRKLETASRRLAHRILARRAGAPPYDLRDEPANAEFIARMKRRGLNLEPWLDDPRTRKVKAKKRTLFLSLERDPLEVLHMGAHFSTCLSPGQFNFFSVFSNIADVNKQVLYARTRDGSVFGRVLLALTDTGGLVSFHVYAHDSKLGFDRLVKSYVNDLARDMGTLVVPIGSISTLVAPKWYDDGPVDLSEQIPAFSDGSSFRAGLKTIDASDLLPAVREALSPLELNELTMPMLLALPELRARPELVAQLLPLARRLELPLEALNRLLTAVGETRGDALGPLVDRLFHQAKRQVGHYFPYDAGVLLACLAPQKALRLLRETREKEVRRWSDEWDGGRLFIAAEAHRLLGRRNKAVALYERALASDRGPIYEKQCRDALEALRPD